MHLLNNTTLLINLIKKIIKKTKELLFIEINKKVDLSEMQKICILQKKGLKLYLSNNIKLALKLV